MIKRWLIRSFFIALLMLCIAAWLASYWRELGVEYAATTSYYFSINWGRIEVAQGTCDYVAGWELIDNPSYEWELSGKHSQSEFSFLEFTFDHHIMSNGATIPLWFPTLLSDVMLLLVWRKTRHKYSGRAFPIEPTVKPGEHKP